MNIAIDNNDGQGGLDYTPATLRRAPLTLERERGRWARCSGGLDLQGIALPVPASRARVLVTDDAGAVLFRGFLQEDARAIAVAGPATTWSFSALDAGWLTGVEPESSLQPATAAVHQIRSEDVAVEYSARSGAEAAADLSTDVTVFGGDEATAYVTELFRGDGTTQTFTLAHPPFRETGSETLVDDSFDGASFDAHTWLVSDPGGYLTLGAGGLQVGGGNGLDGATVLRAAAPVELGGTLVAEAANVALAVGSDGWLLGFYNGAVSHTSCVAGVRVQGGAGAHSLVAVINGVEQTSSYVFANGHRYTLRVRLHCTEVQRVRNSYAALVDGALVSFGGDVVPAPLHIVVEIQDLGLASSTLPSVLFDGAIASAPPRCVFAPVNSTELTGSIGKVSLFQKGSAWVVSTAADGTLTTRREGATGTGADFSLSSTGVLTFDPGRIPQPNELLTVTYRRTARSVARLQDPAAVQARSDLALPGLPAWTGTAHRPAPRSSADCRAAAQALLSLAGGAATGPAATVTWVRGVGTADDVLPGDTLALANAAGVQHLTVHSVQVTDANTVPDQSGYRATCTQDRAHSLSFSVTAALPADASRPAAAFPASSSRPASLAGMQVTTATPSVLGIDGGADPVSGGGFEVRRSDANFGSANTADLVLNSPVRHFDIPRVAFAERFFVRMYDGATPRQYSPISSVVLTSLPLS